MLANMSRSRPRQTSSGTDKTGATGFAEVFRAVGIGAWEWYLDSGLMTLDRTAMALLGIDPGTYDGFIHTWTSLIHPDDSPRVAEEIRRAMLTLDPFEAKYRINRPAGVTQWVRSRG